jgi:DNA polymerase elongation subunit (family B)
LVASCIGWLLHVSIEQNNALLWIKTGDKKVLRLTDSYQPFFYILPKTEYDGTCLFQLLSQQSLVKEISWEESKSTNLFEKYSRNKLICVVLELAQNYLSIVKKLEKDWRVQQLFNTDLSLVQQYLFHKLKIEPTSKIKVEYEDTRLIKLSKIDDENKIDVPPFSILYVDVQTLSGKMDLEDPVMRIMARYEDEPSLQKQSAEILFDCIEEKDTFEEFCNHLQDKDPDIIVSLTDHYTAKILDYLFARMQKLGLDLYLGREKKRSSASFKHPGLQWIKGRLSLNYSTLYNFGFAELIERCRFSFLTLDLAAKYGMNRLIDSRNCFELIQRGFVIPPKNKQFNQEHVRTLEDLVTRDKGGMIIPPQTGLHENVIVLDYDSEYANLIVNHNLSYETILKKGEQVNKSQSTKGLLPIVVEKFLKRRLHFKEMLKGLPANSKEYFWCQQCIDSLKSILVCLYGTTGSLWNRFGNVLVFEEINMLSREVLLKTKDIVQKLGYEVIYADTDSIFIKNNRTSVTTTNEYSQVINTLRRETSLPISIEHKFRFLVLLPLEAIERIEALKQYYGITQDGELVIRAIEARRHDTPNFIKKFQTELLYTLFDCNESEEVATKGYENALLLVTRAIDKIMLGEDITAKDLVISKLLGQNVEKYKSLFPHVCAAIRLGTDENGKMPSKGDNIKYIYTDAQHSNPLSRVTPVKDADKTDEETLRYDKEKYREMILDGAQSVLGYFGFDRTFYEDTKNTMPRKWRWLQELKQQKEKDIKTEMA